MTPGRPGSRPALDGPRRHHEVSGQEPAPWSEEATDHGRDDRVRRVGHDVEGPAWQPQVGGIRPDDRGLSPELGTELGDAAGVELDRDDPSAAADERSRYGAASGADVDDEGVVRQLGVTDQLASDCWMELVPSPPRP
jgi:hypothetical protein